MLAYTVALGACGSATQWERALALLAEALSFASFGASQSQNPEVLGASKPQTWEFGP